MNTINLVVLLSCIAQVETGNNDMVIGRGGERSKYQISKVVWQQHIKKIPGKEKAEFEMECVGEMAHRIALMHVEWLNKVMPNESVLERKMRAYVLAWGWNAGASSWSLKDQPYKYKFDKVRVNNYAVRVQNLYDDSVVMETKDMLYYGSGKTTFKGTISVPTVPIIKAP